MPPSRPSFSAQDPSPAADDPDTKLGQPAPNPTWPRDACSSGAWTRSPGRKSGITDPPTRPEATERKKIDVLESRAREANRSVGLRSTDRPRWILPDPFLGPRL